MWPQKSAFTFCGRFLGSQNGLRIEAVSGKSINKKIIAVQREERRKRTEMREESKERRYKTEKSEQRRERGEERKE